MFSDIGPLPNLTLPVLLGVIGAAAGGAAGWWMEREIRRRRLIKRGFTREDLSSKERFFRRWGEITVAKLPSRISFNKIQSHSWSDPAKYEESRAAFESLGFQRSGTFAALPQNWVAEFWLSTQPELFAKIIDSRERGLYSEVTVMDTDASIASFENTEECGLRHCKPDKWVHCGQVTPAQLVERALGQTRRDDGKQMNLTECLSAYEQAVNEELDWRRTVGINADEMKRTYDRIKVRRSRA